jgi:hypothetical protein
MRSPAAVIFSLMILSGHFLLVVHLERLQERVADRENLDLWILDLFLHTNSISLLVSDKPTPFGSKTAAGDGLPEFKQANV